MSKLQYLLLTNFKSFRGKVVFGPIMDMSVIIGANGSGKSNIMDALCFVMGASSRNMRVKKLGDLIHGAPSGKPIGHSAEVSAVFALDSNSNRIFTRTIHNDSSEYKLNGQVVSYQEYGAKLKELGIILRGKNCLVSQGSVESIAMKSPKELSEFFEELSGSIQYKIEYDRFNEELRRLKDQMHYLFIEKKSMLAFKNRSSKLKKEAEAYKKLQDEFIKLKSRLQLFELYHIKIEVEDLEESEKAEEAEIKKLEEKKENICNKLKEKKIKIAKLSRQLELVDRDIQEIDDEFKTKIAHYNSVREEIVYWETKLKNTNAILTESRAAHEAHIRTIKELGNERKEIERMMEEFEASVVAELSSQGSSVDLSNSQVSEYTRLQPLVQNESLIHARKLKNIEQEQDKDQCMLDNEERKKADFEHKLQCRKIVVDETEKRIRKLQHYIKETEDDLGRVMKLKDDLGEQFKLFKEQRVNIETELNEIYNQLKDAAYDNQSMIRTQRKAETVHSLRNLSDGKIYGRVSELCNPVHSRYKVAVAKVFGKYLDAIIVDTVDTAKHCVDHLKQGRLGVETFLPLDNLKVAPLKERLRDFPSEKNVKLLYDVIQISTNDISNAILFITKNTLVCETPTVARKIAYELKKEYKQNCVALDGTLYRKDGTFSGGLADLSRKAKVWEENLLVNLKAKQSSLQDQLREISKTLHIESDLNTIDTQIYGFVTRLKYSKSSLKECTRTLEIVKNEIKVFSEELNLVCSTIMSINSRMKERNQNIQDIKKVINSIEDRVYANFCRKIGVNNIRQYEQRDLIRHQEQEKRRLDFEMQRNRINNMLNYEGSRDTKSALRKNEKLIKTIGQDLEKARRNEATAKLKLDEEKSRLQGRSENRITIATGLAELERKNNEYKEEVKVVSKLSRAAETKRISTHTNIEKKKAAAQFLIKNSKMTGIDIPLLPGNTNQSPLDSTDKSSSDPAAFDEILQVDFSKLSEDLKCGNVSMNRHQLNLDVAEIQRQLEEIEPPDMRIQQKLEVTVEKLNVVKHKLQMILRTFNSMNQDFQEIKEKRLKAFNECFEHISIELDKVFKSLYKDTTVTALIVPENVSEPYLGGLYFNCIASGKRLQPLDSLSGGEKTLASLAIIYAFNCFMSTPFFAFDEIDAALDDIAVNNLISFIFKKKSTVPFIIVSLGKIMYYADALYGITTEPETETMESVLFTLDLLQFPPSRERIIMEKSTDTEN